MCSSDLTVEADRCVDADAAATALFGAPRDQAVEILALARVDATIAHSAVRDAEGADTDA